jgi:glycosyltransferase involved in cell wall biosynthesis
MKVVHITLHYLDGWGYQDNLLPLYQAHAGHSVTVLADNGHFPHSMSIQERQGILGKGSDYWDGPVRVRKFRTAWVSPDTALLCSGLGRLLGEEAPDLIFHHGLHLSTLLAACRYVRRHPRCVLMADSHADPVNASKYRLWRALYGRFALRLLVRTAGRQVDRFYGVTPLRCQYLVSEYAVPADKVRLLPLAGDDRGLTVDAASARRSFGIPEDAFLVVSGGRMGSGKGTDRLVEAWRRLRPAHPGLELLLFGTMEEPFPLPEGVHTVGWCNREKTLSILSMADTAVWPLLHTTLVEDAVVCGTPLIVKDSGNVSHFKEEGFGLFLASGSVDEITAALERMIREAPSFRTRLETGRKRYTYASLVQQLETDYQSFTCLP